MIFIESYDDYGDFETMIISAVVAEQEQNGLNAGQQIIFLVFCIQAFYFEGGKMMGFRGLMVVI